MYLKKQTGLIEYFGDKAGRRGLEEFTITTHKDGSKTLRSLSEIFDSEVQRDVICTVDKHWNPVDSYVAVRIGGSAIGSGYFCFRNPEITARITNLDHGLLEQTFRVPEREGSRLAPLGFAHHGVVGDAWHTALFDHSRPEGAQDIPVVSSSSMPNGASGPILSFTNFPTRYLGRENISVPAGEFEVDHYVYVLKDGPPEHVWVTPKDRILVKMRWDYYLTTYQLVEFRQE